MTMLFLLDTNILLAYTREGVLASQIEAKYSLLSASELPLISIVSEGELRSLALQFGWGTLRTQRIEALLNVLTVVPLPYQGIVEIYAEIDDNSKRRGVPMGKNDVWIAATAHVTRAALLS